MSRFTDIPAFGQRLQPTLNSGPLPVGKTAFVAWPFFDQKTQVSRDNRSRFSEVCEVGRKHDFFRVTGIAFPISDTQSTIVFTMERVDLLECAVVRRVVDVVAVAMHHAAVHVWLFAREARV